MTVDVLGDLLTAEPVRMDARTIVIRDDHGQPVLVAQAMENGKIFTARAGSPDFKDALTSLGIEVEVKYREVKIQ